MTKKFNHIILSNPISINKTLFIGGGLSKGKDWLDKRTDGTINDWNLNIRHF